MSPHTRSARRAPRPAESGIALVLALFAMTTLLVVAASALLVGSADIRATRNYREASQVHFVADSAIAHAMQVVNGPGVVSFQNDVVTPWPTLFGSAALTFGPVGGYAYTVFAVSDPTDPVNWGRFVATATGPEGVRNVVAARVNRSNIPTAAPGAIYLSLRMAGPTPPSTGTASRSTATTTSTRVGSPARTTPSPASRPATTPTRRKRSTA